MSGVFFNNKTIVEGVKILPKASREELDQKTAKKFGINYYANFCMLVAPDPENPDIQYMNTYLPTAQVYVQGSWRTIVISGRAYRYREGKNAAEWILHEAQEAQKFLLRSLRKDKSPFTSDLHGKLSNPIDHFPPRNT